MSSMKNKYIVRSRISEKKFREILWYFSADIEAVKIAEFTDISEKTINLALALSLRNSDNIGISSFAEQFLTIRV